MFFPCIGEYISLELFYFDKKDIPDIDRGARFLHVLYSSRDLFSINVSLSGSNPKCRLLKTNRVS